MKKIILIAALTLSALTSFAEYDATSAGDKGPRQLTQKLSSLAEVDSVTVLVNKQRSQFSRPLTVKVIVASTGGSTDVSPTKKIYFALYSETDQSTISGLYNIGLAFKISSISRESGGVYKITGRLSDYNKETSILINAIHAVNEISSMNCGESEHCYTTKPVIVE